MEHICKYSKSMNQEYPRKGVVCGKPEMSQETIKDKLESFVRYFELCDTCNNSIPKMDKYQEEDLLYRISIYENLCISNIDTLKEVIKKL